MKFRKLSEEMQTLIAIDFFSSAYLGEHSNKIESQKSISVW